MRTSFALIHHANQYLITNGYDNREGIEAIAGTDGSPSGFLHVLRLHQRLQIPFNLHISGTLLEALAWHVPEFLSELRRLLETGLIELVGSSYGQNIMRFFPAEYNLRQLNEELNLYRLHLGIDPRSVKAFWPPERVWDTKRMAPVLRDAGLVNDGYRYVILDDRLLLDPDDSLNPRRRYDATGEWDPDLFRMHEIEDGLGLVAFPIATRLRRSIPPQQEDDWRRVQSDLEALLVHAAESEERDLLAMYADDMEKVSGIGEWGDGGPARYEAFLEWLAANRQWLNTVKLTEWAAGATVSDKRRIHRGTFQELAVDFDAGEGYERWYLAPDWAPYRAYFAFAESKVKEARAQGGDAALLELADKQLLVSNWETAWHTPASGPHGDADKNGHASPWARALTSHSRHAAVTAAAAIWAVECDDAAHASCVDLDNDDQGEIVLCNRSLYAVVTPRYGARLVALFRIGCPRGVMVVGNPCDDWNWLEELNRYMDVPRNHPGAFADVGLEHEEYEASILDSGADVARVGFRSAQGILKTYELYAEADSIVVTYELPAPIQDLATEIGLSPDYLSLLRHGRDCLSDFVHPERKGCRVGQVAAWVQPVSAGLMWEAPAQSRFGHGCTFRLRGPAPGFSLRLGATAFAEDGESVAHEPEAALA